MSVELIDEKLPQTEQPEEEVIPLPPTDLPYDDGEPLESNRHRIAMNVLIASLHQAYQGRNDYYTGGNMFVYYSSAQARNQDFRGPDFFVVLDVDGTLERRSRSPSPVGEGYRERALNSPNSHKQHHYPV